MELKVETLQMVILEEGIKKINKIKRIKKPLPQSKKRNQVKIPHMAISCLSWVHPLVNRIKNKSKSKKGRKIQKKKQISILKQSEIYHRKNTTEKM